MALPQIKNRNWQSDQTRDPSAIDNITYNERAGARKVTEVGKYLIPLNNGAGGFTTDASTVRVLQAAGLNLAIYNNSGTVQAVTFGDSTMAPQAAGIVQTGANAPFVGIPCTPNSWTYVASGIWQYVGTSNASLLVFVIDDPSYVVVQPQTNSSNAQQTTGPENT
jgi:hypothetical protein